MWYVVHWYSKYSYQWKTILRRTKRNSLWSRWSPMVSGMPKSLISTLYSGSCCDVINFYPKYAQQMLISLLCGWDMEFVLWNRNVIILMKFSSMAVLGVFKMITFENIIKMITLPPQCFVNSKSGVLYLSLQCYMQYCVILDCSTFMMRP